MILFRRACSILALLFTTCFAMGLANPTTSSLERHSLPLKSATVYLQGAELFHSGKIAIPQGESTLLFTDIANNINEHSLFINSSEPLMIKSYRVTQDYLNESNKAPNNELKTRLKTIKERQEELNINKKVIESQIAALEENISLGGSEFGVTVEEIGQLWDFVAESMNRALEDKLILIREERELKKEEAKVRKQMADNYPQNAGKEITNLLVEVVADQAMESTIELSYAIDRARWIPTYDFYVEQKDAPINIVYKASLEQFSGLDWENVALTFSTSEIKQRLNSLTLSPRRLFVDAPISSSGSVRQMKDAGSRIGLKGGEYLNSGEQVLYEPEWGFDESAKLKQAAPQAPMSARSREANSMADHIAIDMGGLDATYSIAVPYTVPSDGKPHHIVLKTEKAKGAYRYIAVPLLQEAVYLEVALKEWEGLNLLPGKATLYIAGRYLGETAITLDNIYEKDLALLLGEDKQISIKRQDTGRYNKQPGLFGNNVTQEYSYSLNLHNSRSEAVTVTVIDQIPISTSDEIRVIDLKYDRTAMFNNDNGEVIWEVEVQPNKSIKLPLSYSIRYPQGSSVFGLK